jgi:predicted transposase YbfD/YdcC
LYKSLTLISQTELPDSIFQEQDSSHGRLINRETQVFNVCNKLNNKWSQIKTFIKVIRKGKRGNKNYQQIAYYISSKEENAQHFAEKIRAHWQIENQLHWVKDVILGEDKSLISQCQPATNLSILQTIVLNFFRILGFLSITEGQRWLSTKASRLQVLLL